MKRTFSIVLCTVILVSAMVIPVSAAESDFTYNLLDFATPNNSGSLQVSFSGSGLYSFEVPQPDSFGYVDMLFFVSDAYSVTSVKAGGSASSSRSSLTLIHISSNLYRAYGSISFTSYDRVYVELIGSGTVYFERFDIGSYGFFDPDVIVRGYGTVVTANDLNIGYNVSGLPNSYMYTFQGDFNDSAFRTYYSFDAWRAHDYLDLQLYYVVSSITSVSCTLGDLTVPVDVSYLESNSVGGPGYFVTLHIDLTEIPRSLSGELEVQVIGISNYDTTGMIAIVGATAITRAKQDPISLWFYKTNHNLDLWFDGVILSIETWGQNIVNAINPESDAGEEAKSEAQQKAEEVKNMTSQMNNVSRPDMDGAGDISAVIPSDQLVNNTLFLSHVLNAPYISTVVTLALILSLAAYVLFGKR